VLRPRSALILAPIAALAIAAPGCGGGGDSSSTTASTGATGTAGATGPPVASNEVAVVETEYEMAPSNVLPDDGEGGPPTSKAKAGKVTFHIVNDGTETHSFVFNNGGKEIPIDGDLAPGESADLTVDVTSGYFEYYCPLDHHQDKGMQGQLQVG
jgi:plastocyanin